MARELFLVLNMFTKTSFVCILLLYTSFKEFVTSFKCKVDTKGLTDTTLLGFLDELMSE